MKKAIWMSFDLGIQGDYQSLYQWLDTHEAIECGENIAFFNFEADDLNSVPDQIKRSLGGVVVEESRARIYVIWRDAGKVKGRFILGQRKSAPWSGYAPRAATEDSA